MIRYIRSVTLTYLAQIITFVLTFVCNIIIVRILGASGKGTIALLQNYFSILVTIFIFGMSEANVYYLGNQRYQHRNIFLTMIFQTLIISTIIVILSMVLKNWIIGHFLKNIRTEYYIFASWLFPSFFLLMHLSTMLLGHKNILGYNTSIVSRYFFILVFQIILIPKYGIIGALIAIVTGFFVADAVAIVFLSKYGMPSLSINVMFLKDAFIFGAKSQIGLILNQIDRRLDVFIINLFSNTAQVGFYAIAVAMAEIPWYISNALATVLFPEVSGMKKEDAYKFAAFICRNTLFITVLFCIFLFIAGGLLIKITFGAQFLISITPLRYLIPGIIALSITKLLGASFSGTGKPEYGSYTTIFSAITTLILDIILIPAFGIKGAAIASTIAYSLSAVTSILLFKNISGLAIEDVLLITSNDIRKYPNLLKQFMGSGRHEK